MGEVKGSDPFLRTRVLRYKENSIQALMGEARGQTKEGVALSGHLQHDLGLGWALSRGPREDKTQPSFWLLMGGCILPSPGARGFLASNSC